MAIIGGGMISRLWIGRIFRAEVKTHAKSFGDIQKGFIQLSWNESLPAGLQEAVGSHY